MSKKIIKLVCPACNKEFILTGKTRVKKFFNNPNQDIFCLECVKKQRTFYKYCSYCGKNFYGSKKQLYCDECKEKDYYDRCISCGRVYRLNRNQKLLKLRKEEYPNFCKNCSKHAKTHENRCILCQNVFFGAPLKKICDQCRDIIMHEQKINFNDTSNIIKKITRKCKNCGSTFKLTIAQIRKESNNTGNPHLFCSECVKHGNIHEHECISCGKVFYGNAQGKLCDECRERSVTVKCHECGKTIILYGEKLSRAVCSGKLDDKNAWFFCSQECINRSKDIRKKMSETYFNNTGYDNPSKNPIVKAQKIATCLKNNNVENGFMTDNALKNNKFSSWGAKTHLIFTDRKDIITRSTWETIFALWLYYNNILFEYEPFCIEYIDSDTKAKRKYLPDFIINNRIIIEVKGRIRDIKELRDKRKGCIKAGYKFILINDRKSIENCKAWLIDNTQVNIEHIIQESKLLLRNGSKEIFRYKVNL